MGMEYDFIYRIHYTTVSVDLEMRFYLRYTAISYTVDAVIAIY